MPAQVSNSQSDILVRFNRFVPRVIPNIENTYGDGFMPRSIATFSTGPSSSPASIAPLTDANRFINPGLEGFPLVNAPLPFNVVNTNINLNGGLPGPVGPQGPPGAPGSPGSPGAPGSDATVDVDSTVAETPSLGPFIVPSFTIDTTANELRFDTITYTVGFHLSSTVNGQILTVSLNPETANGVFPGNQFIIPIAQGVLA